MSDIIMKCGGSSITAESDIERIARITRDDARRRVVVVSAPGKRTLDDTKVTDMLIELNETTDVSLIDKIMDRYAALGASADLTKGLREELMTRLQQRPESRLDAVKAFGEYASASVVAQRLGVRFVDAADVIKVTSDFGNAKILPESRDLLRKMSLDDGIVMPGFYGSTKEGDIATFSRGGSDLTGAYVAASLNAELYENYTDSGIKAAYPFVENPHTISELTFGEMRDLSYSGFGIFHPEAMGPVALAGVPVHVRGFRSYPEGGTYIVTDRPSNGKPVIGVAYRSGFAAVNIDRFAINEEKGVARKVLQVFENHGVSFEFMPSAVDDITLVVPEGQLGTGRDITRLYSNIRNTIGQNTAIEKQDGLACLVAVGKGIKQHASIDAEIKLALVKNGVDVYFSDMGAKRRCAVFGIAEKDGPKAVNLVYDQFVK